MAPKTALVLAGGGMFGAYQAGVWKTLASRFQPDLVVGASIGAINGWAMAAGCPPDEWIDQWLHMEGAERHRWRIPWPPLSGVVDASLFEDFVQRVHRHFQPRVPFAAALTTLPRLRPRYVETPAVTWRHLAASCALFGILPQYKIEGTWYTDGGLLGAMPAWAALQLGARRLVCVSILPGRHPPSLPEGVEMVWIEHGAPLGSPLDSVYWSRDKAMRMIEYGQKDAETALPQLAVWTGA